MAKPRRALGSGLKHSEPFGTPGSEPFGTDHTVSIRLEASPTGRYLAAGDNTSTLHIWDTQAGPEWNHTALPMTFASQIAFSPKEDRLIVNQWNGEGHAAVVSLSGKQPVMLDEGINAYHAFSPDGRRAYRADAGLQVLDTETWTPIIEHRDVARNQSPDPTGLVAYPEFETYAVFEPERTRFHDLQDDHLLRTVEARLDADPLSRQPLRFAAHRGNRVFVYDYAGDTLLPMTDLEGDFDATSDYLVRVTKSTVIAGQLDVEFFHVGEVQPFARAAVPAVSEDLQFGDAPHQFGFGSLIDRGGRYWVLRTWWKDGVGRDTQYSRRIRVFDITNGALVKDLNLSSGVRRLAPDVRKASGLLLKLDQSTVPLDFEAMNLEPALPLGKDDQLIWQDKNTRVVQRRDGVWIGDAGGIRGQWKLPPHQGRLTGASYWPNSRKLLLLDTDGGVQKISLPTLENTRDDTK